MEEDERLAKEMEENESESSYDSESDSSEIGSERAAQLDAMFEDSVGQIEFEREAFDRESFKQLIEKTFEDYYPQIYNLDSYKLEEYMELVAKEQLEAKFGVYLERNGDNVLTIKNMPWLDMGELPFSYSRDKSEGF
jgi:hypothetical protein